MFALKYFYETIYKVDNLYVHHKGKDVSLFDITIRIIPYSNKSLLALCLRKCFTWLSNKDGNT